MSSIAPCERRATGLIDAAEFQLTPEARDLEEMFSLVGSNYAVLRWWLRCSTERFAGFTGGPPVGAFAWPRRQAGG